jgi:hypothetical protein
MAYIAKLVINDNPNQLTNNERAAKVDSLVNDPDFLGLKPGNPIYLLYSTEEAAASLVAIELADPKVSAFLDSAEVVTLESQGLDRDEFYDMQTVAITRDAI